MKWVFGLLALLLAPLLLLFLVWFYFAYPSFFHLSYPSYTYHYRLTLEIEAAGKVHTGSSVFAVNWRWRAAPDVYGAWTDTVQGQAVAVELGQRGLLLARLDDEGYFGGVPVQEIAQIVIGSVVTETPPAAVVNSGYASWQLNRATRTALRKLEGRRIALSPSGAMPSLVWLPDPGNPASAVPVPRADLLPAIVPDADLRGAWIEITHDSVTTDLFARLPWLAERYQSEKGSGRASTRGVLMLPAWTLTRGIDP
jgi:hypothetical protein